MTAIVPELPSDPAALSLDALVEDPGRLAALPFETVLELRRHVRHLDADLEAAALRRLADRVGLGNQGTGRDDDQLLSVPEASAQLGLAPSYVYELARTGALPTVRVGKYVRVRVGALRGWLAGREMALDPVGSETRPTTGNTRRRLARPPRHRADAGKVRRGARRPPGYAEDVGGRHAGDAQHGNSRDPAAPRVAEGKGRSVRVALSDDDERW